MTRRFSSILLAAVLAAAACAYESPGTTTTTVVDPADVPPATGPADVVFRDQMTDGAGVVVESVSLPEPGFLVLYGDQDGSPGEVIGATQIIPAGVIANVPVSFFVPLEADAVVHAQLHIDMDRDEAFTYEPPDAFVDVPATRANGEVAAAVASVGLLPPFSPAVVTLAEQRTIGSEIVVLSVDLPAPGFVVIREDDQGEAGRFLGTSELLPAGVSENVVVTLDEPIEISAVLFGSLFIDRDGDGALVLGEGAVDRIARGADGLEATIGVPITVVPLGPVILNAPDQETDGTELTVTATVPAPAFVVLRADAGGSPGGVVAVSGLLPLGATGVTFDLDPAIESDTTFWVSVHIDFDGDGEFGDDPVGLDDAGNPAEASLLVTLPEPEEEDDGA